MGNFLKHYSRFARISGAMMVFVYAGTGGLLLFFPVYGMNIKGTTRYILGVVLIFYAVFRAYRVFKSSRD
jgi:hypothetical protein